MAELQSLTFGDLGQLFDGPHATPTRRDEGPYFLNISSLKAGRLDLAESDHVGEEDFAKWTRRVTPQEDDLLFSYETRLGEAALMPAGVEACLGRRMALLRPDRDVVDPRFLLYYYLSPSFQRAIEKNTIHGATVPRIGLATMPQWEVEIPDLPTQRSIAEVLGALDDKIAANDRILRTLDQLNESDVSLARRAGDQRALRDVVTLHYGKALPAAKRVEGEVTVYGSGGASGTHNTALVAGPGIVLGRKGTVGAVHWADAPHFPIDTTYFVEPIDGVPAEVVYYLLRQMPLADLNSDSAVPGLNREEAYAQPLRVPERAELARLQIELSNRFALAAALRAEQRRLAATRDELLPLLMSGKLRVRDIAQPESSRGGDDGADPSN